MRPWQAHMTRSGFKIPQTHRYGVADTSAVPIDGVSTALLDVAPRLVSAGLRNFETASR